jgi:hypothetical protein
MLREDSMQAEDAMDADATNDRVAAAVEADPVTSGYPKNSNRMRLLDGSDRSAARRFLRGSGERIGTRGRWRAAHEGDEIRWSGNSASATHH